MKEETASVRIQADRSSHNEHSVPVYLTSSFMFSSADEMKKAFQDEIEHDVYSRFSNPNVNELIDKICALEGAEDGYATASGMAAVFATFGALCKSGDHILSIRSVFGATHTLFTKILPKWGITTSYVECDVNETWETALTPHTRMLYIETPTNPGLEIVDLQKAGAFAKKHNLILVVDNCFATPVIQKPVAYGAHLVIHSATKYLDGQGRVLGGVVVGKKELIHEIYLFSRTTGPALSPFNAWVISKSLETLSLRMEKHSANALELAIRLQQTKGIMNVKYPLLDTHPQYNVARSQMKAGGGLLTFELQQGYGQAVKFIDALYMCSLTANLGDSRSIVTHPASSTHSKLSEEERARVGISQGLIRVSAGLENVEDIAADLLQAIGKSMK